MMRSIKLVGLMVVAALAMGALFASAVQAEGAKGIFTGGETPEINEDVTIQGEQIGEPTTEVNYFEILHGTEGAAKTECDIGTYSGTLDMGAQTEIKVKPHYTHCKASGLPATVTMNGCEYKFKQPTTINQGAAYTGKAALTCPTSTGPVIHAYLFGSATSHSVGVCTVEISAGHETGGEFQNEFGGHVIYKDHKTTPDTVTVEATVSEIEWSRTGSCGATSGTDGTFVSTVTVKAFGDNNPEPHNVQRDLWIGHHPNQ